MDPQRALRTLVVAQIALLAIGVVLGIALEQTLPDSLRNWLDEDGQSPVSGLEITILVFGASVLSLYVAAWIEIWTSRARARVLYTAACAGWLVLNGAAGPYVMTGVESAIDLLEGIASGLILGILYFSDLSRVFRPPGRAGRLPPEDDLIG